MIRTQSNSPPDVRGGYYALALDESGRWALLLGPYDTRDQAAGVVDDARRLSIGLDLSAIAYRYGTGRVASGELDPGRLNHLLEGINLEAA